LEQQQSYINNFLNLGKDSHGRPRILTSSKELQKVLKANDVTCNVYDMDFSAISSMSGGPRSSSFVLRRE